jgi:hypothetical protein
MSVRLGIFEIKNFYMNPADANEIAGSNGQNETRFRAGTKVNFQCRFTLSFGARPSGRFNSRMDEGDGNFLHFLLRVR